MTLARLLPFHIHGALEATLAPIIMAAPFVLGFELPAAALSVVIGASMLAVVLATHATDEGGLPISAHAALDIAFATAMALGAVLVGIAGDLAAAAFLAAMSLAVLLIMSLTRYSPSTA